VKDIIIKAAAIKDSFCNYTYDQEIAPNTTDTVSRKSGLMVHDDMRAAFLALNPHLAVICEEVDGDEISDIETIEKFDEDTHKEGSLEHKISHFSVSAFKVDGTGENEGVTLIGQKRLKTGEFVKLETPKVKWEDNEYIYVNELRLAIEKCVEEVEAYMKGKCAPRLVQQELFEEEEKFADETA
jgi:hypothetical protein